MFSLQKQHWKTLKGLVTSRYLLGEERSPFTRENASKLKVELTFNVLSPETRVTLKSLVTFFQVLASQGILRISGAEYSNNLGTA